MSFDLLAPHYRWMEFVLAGGKLQRCRTAYLPEISTPQNILLLGEGHGRGLLACCQRFPEAQITCVDASAGMLRQARRRELTVGQRIHPTRFIHANALTWLPPREEFDLLVTNFFLDCFRPDQLALLVSRLGQAATPDANWLVADFQVASSGWKQIRSRLILWSMYVFFRVVTRLPAQQLTAPDSFLKSEGFALHRRIESEWGLLHSDWWRRSQTGG